MGMPIAYTTRTDHALELKGEIMWWVPARNFKGLKQILTSDFNSKPVLVLILDSDLMAKRRARQDAV